MIADSSVDVLAQWHRQRQVCFPKDYRFSLPDVSAALQAFAKGEDHPLGRQLESFDHVVLLLIDGFGLHQQSLAGPNGLFADKPAHMISSVFPSATACALTALATSRPPGDHGVFGWWTYYPELDITANPLLDIDTDGRPLPSLNITADDIYRLPSRATEGSLHFLPADYVDSTFTRYFAGAGSRQGYGLLEDITQPLVQHVRTQTERSYSTIYFPLVDAYSHEYGVDAPQTVGVIAHVQTWLERLLSALPRSTGVMVTADHGQLNCPRELAFLLTPDDDVIWPLLKRPPSCEPRAPVFHVRDGQHEVFQQRFSERFGEYFTLFSLSELEQFDLFGPRSVDPRFRDRLGDFIALSPTAAVIDSAPSREGYEPHVGIHGGLLAQELEIPLRIHQVL